MATTQYTVRELYDAYTKLYVYKDIDEQLLTIKQLDKWAKQASFFNKTMTASNVGIHYAKMKARKGLTYDRFMDLLEELGDVYRVDPAKLKIILARAGMPEVSKANVFTIPDQTNYKSLPCFIRRYKRNLFIYRRKCETTNEEYEQYAKYFDKRTC